MVGVVPHQRRHVERGREAGLAVVEQVPESLVRLLGRAEARELPEGPQPAAVHRRVDAARVRVLARESRVFLDVVRGVERVYLLARDRREERFPLGRLQVLLAVPALCVGQAGRIGHAPESTGGRPGRMSVARVLPPPHDERSSRMNPGPRNLLAVLAATCAVVLGGAAQASADCPNADTIPTAENLEEIRAAVICLHNEERAKADVRDAALGRAADRGSPGARRGHGHATATSATTRPPVSTRSTGCGVTGYIAPRVRVERRRDDRLGLRLTLATPRSVVTAWLYSTSQRLTLLAPDFRRHRRRHRPRARRSTRASDAAPAVTYTVDYGWRTSTRRRCAHAYARRRRSAGRQSGAAMRAKCHGLEARGATASARAAPAALAQLTDQVAATAADQRDGGSERPRSAARRASLSKRMIRQPSGARDPLERGVRVDRDGVADGAQHRQVRLRVRVRVRLREVDPLLRRALADRLGLPLAIGERALGLAGVDAVAHLRARADAAVEEQDVRHQLGHLVRRGGHDEDAAGPRPGARRPRAAPRDRRAAGRRPAPRGLAARGRARACRRSRRGSAAGARRCPRRSIPSAETGCSPTGRARAASASSGRGDRRRGRSGSRSSPRSASCRGRRRRRRS